MRLILSGNPDIPALVTVKPGQTFSVECVDWTGAQIGNNDVSDDIRDVDLDCVHNLSGPIAIEGAESGDCLVVDIGIFELENGGGLFAKEFNSIYATSRHIPGVRFAGIPHPGLIGTAPCAERLTTWNKREGALIAAHANDVPAVAYGPKVRGAYVGQELDETVREKIYREGARTIPGREHGGNCDVNLLQCSRGSRCYFPVFINGITLSVGDLHFSQGDMSFCGAIEMAGIITFSTSIIKGGVEKFALKQPIFLVSLVFEGISVDYPSGADGDGTQYNMDATVAYKQAALNAIAYLQKVWIDFHHLLLSAAPVESHVGAVVDSPNACVTLALPLGIFEHVHILRNEEGLKKLQFGQCAVRSDGVL
ncbi:Acetamidase/Formamidase [Pisolithus thermaeus]|nr:Acetamidase/Formamidase [Pisolithus sp. B1]KAI6112197.1 Acetamidase/Formamidase [Pisolithus croceorrhizus]KAI6165828.1 Acetamidase/Formamidase [Pisolithus thermaeus]